MKSKPEKIHYWIASNLKHFDGFLLFIRGVIIFKEYLLRLPTNLIVSNAISETERGNDMTLIRAPICTWTLDIHAPSMFVCVCVCVCVCSYIQMKIYILKCHKSTDRSRFYSYYLI